MRLVKYLMGNRRVLVRERQRVIVHVKELISDVLMPGEHWVRWKNTRLVTCHIRAYEVDGELAEALWKRLPTLAKAHVTRIETAVDQVALVTRAGRMDRVLLPERRVDLWSDAGPWAVEYVELPADLAVPEALARRLNRIEEMIAPITTAEVPPGAVGVVAVDGQIVGLLDPGAYSHWDVEGRTVAVSRIETRWQSIEVSGQEVLTRDRVTLRLNVTAAYRVADVMKAVTAIDAYKDALYTALQLAYRKTVGSRTLDELLGDKIAVDEDAAAAVRSAMAEIGLEVGEIALKDVILPGDMRDILNQVVAAQKESEANIIRRREETNATRSLLNTAKVIAENPVMLRLKELEALERVVGKVDRLSVTNGTEGLLRDIVRLRD